MKTSEIKTKIIDIAERNSINIEYFKNFKKEEISVNVAFLGEFNAGKSTVINALLGKKLLPTFETPTTAVITEISNNSEDYFEVVRMSDDGTDERIKIEQMDLAHEITNTELNKKIIIKLKDLHILKDNLTIIDTPGVNSTIEAHTNLTYSYLPNVDVAFIVLNINEVVPLSLSNFLKQFPKEQLKKIILVLNFIDKLEKNDIEKLKKSIILELSAIIGNSRIILVSPFKAISIKQSNDKSDYSDTGISEIENIINNDIPELKKEIQESRFTNYLKSQAKNLIELLEIRKSALSWNTEEFDNEINLLENEISNINSDLTKFKSDYNNIKTICISHIKETITDNIEVIGNKIAKDEPYDEIINLIIEDTNISVEKAILRIKDLKMDSINLKFSDVIKSSLESGSQQIKIIADLLTDAATFAVTAWLMPVPAGETTGSAGKVAMETTEKIAAGGGAVVAGKFSKIEKPVKVVDKVNKSSKILEKIGSAMKVIGLIIKEINPLEKVKVAILPFILNPKLRNILINKMIYKLELIFNEIEFEVNKIIENDYMFPIKQKEGILSNLKSEKGKAIINVDKTKEIIENDVNTLKSII